MLPSLETPLNLPHVRQFSCINGANTRLATNKWDTVSLRLISVARSYPLVSVNLGLDRLVGNIAASSLPLFIRPRRFKGVKINIHNTNILPLTRELAQVPELYQSVHFSVPGEFFAALPCLTSVLHLWAGL
jgi:hypothetical protein